MIKNLRNDFIFKLINMSRFNKQLLMMFVDFISILMVLFLAFSIRFANFNFPWYFPIESFISLILVAPFIAILILKLIGFYKSIIRYVGFEILWIISKAGALYVIIWGALCFLTGMVGIPRSIIFINWILFVLFLTCSRLLARWFLFRKDFNVASKKTINSNTVMVYGAGVAGIQLMSALKHSSGYKIVGFFDDSVELQGNFIAGTKIFSSRNIDSVLKRLKVDEILIALPSISRSRRLSIANKFASHKVTVRMLPSMSDLAKGKISVNDLHKISIKDLLGRESAEPSDKLLSKNIKNKVVLVTGAGGSIGSELCRQIIYLQPKVLILYEMSENALYNIEKELISTNIEKKVKVQPILGNVTNKTRLIKVFTQFNVNTIYHAAAYKHVPMVEFNTSEGVENNIFGTLNCAKAAIDANVQTFVLISTDKAVRPTNIMGATKRTAELILQALSVTQAVTIFSIVRFGNVLDSSGSVIPLFNEQISKGGPVTVTDKKIIRYFMTIPEAVELVIQAGAMGLGGDVFLLDMGKPVNIDDLARKMIRLSGLEVKDKDFPEGDIEIKYVGLRPGEKLYEELLVGNNVAGTKNPYIVRAKEDMLLWNDIKPILNDLKEAVNDIDLKKIRRLLIKLVENFKPHKDIADPLLKKIK